MTFRIDPARPLIEEVRRIGADEIARSVAILEETNERRLTGLHDTRKRLKKLRGLVRLIRAGDPDFAERENSRLRDTARSLSAAREASALVETIDRFRADFAAPEHQAVLERVRRRLVRRRTRIVRAGPGVTEPVHAAITALREIEADLGRMALPEAPHAAAAILSSGVAGIVRRARKQLKQARRSGEPEHFHELRKVTKHYWFAIGLLHAVWPRALEGHRGEAKRLGDLLGELHDVAVMRALSRAAPDDLGSGDDIAHLLRLMKRKEQELKGKCLADSAALYATRPKAVEKLIAEAWLAASVPAAEEMPGMETEPEAA